MRRYTAEEIQFLRDNVKGRSYADIIALFNERFGTDKTQGQIKCVLSKRGLKTGPKFTQEQIEFIRDNIVGTPLKDMTILFNRQFGTAYPQTKITSAVYRHGFKNGIDAKLKKGWEPTQFKPGHIPYCKGKKRWWVGGEETQFKKGNVPWNYRPIGSEKISDGYVWVKVADPHKWKIKHRLVWEAANGPVPKGHVVIFGDGNRMNFELDNLLLVSRRQLVVMNARGLISEDPELTKAGIAVADVYLKIHERKRKGT